MYVAEHIGEHIAKQFGVQYSMSQSAKDFNNAKRKASASKVLSAARAKSDYLLSLDKVREVIGPTSESYVGVKTVPVDRIVGSEARYRDFNKMFLPLRGSLRARWESVDSAYCQGIALPPVKLFEIGGVYFVRDGNHRVSVARTKKNKISVDAEITRFTTEISLKPGMTINEIKELVKAEKN